MDKNNFKKETFLDLISNFAKNHHLKIIMHFPHSSLKVKKSIYKDLYIEKNEFNFLNLKMSDVLLLDLFKNWPYKKIIAKYSRLYVDVEKYWDDKKEIMAKYGMGAIYQKDLYGNPLHKKEKNFCKKGQKYYNLHHKKLIKACNIKQDVLILDIHSFNDDMAKVFQDDNHFPLLCIGVNNDKSCNKELLKEITEYFSFHNFTDYKINYPYEGAILPNYQNGKNKIYSLMLEINKKLYL